MSFFVVMFLALGAVFTLFIIASGLYTVDQQSVAIVERFGKFIKVTGAGLHLKIPLIDKISGKVSLRVQQLDVKAETKTKDNVFVNVLVSVQYYVLPESVYEAFYKLNLPEVQINSYVFDVVRARVPKITLDELFEKKDEIAVAVKEELNETMVNFGFGILNTLVTDIEPDSKVKDSMNEINAAQRSRVAAAEKGEADKILKVKAAEAEAESKALQGKGVADQRKAIIDGLRESVEEFSTSIQGTSAADVMNIVMMTQYFDTLREIGEKANTNTILMPHSPAGMTDISSQIRDSIIIAGEINKPHNPASPTEGAK